MNLADDPKRHAYYGGRNKAGNPCGAPVIPGTRTCKFHGGKSETRLRAEGNVVVELRRWGLGDAKVDPGEVLLRLVSQSAARVELYAGLLQEAYDAAGQLQDLGALDEILAEPEVRTSFRGDDVLELPEHAARQVARQQLRRIFLTGPVAALIGHTYTSTKDGDVFATGEAIRGLAKLEAEERDRCATFAAKAIAAGLAERQVRLAERQGAEMAGVFRRVLAALGLSAEQRALVPGVLAREIAAITGAPKVIEARA
jgi:hypothetical protein